MNDKLPKFKCLNSLRRLYKFRLYYCDYSKTKTTEQRVRTGISEKGHHKLELHQEVGLQERRTKTFVLYWSYLYLYARNSHIVPLSHSVSIVASYLSPVCVSLTHRFRQQHYAFTPLTSILPFLRSAPSLHFQVPFFRISISSLTRFSKSIIFLFL